MRPGLYWARWAALAALIIQAPLALILLDANVQLGMIGALVMLATAAMVMLDIARAGDDRG